MPLYLGGLAHRVPLETVSHEEANAIVIQGIAEVLFHRKSRVHQFKFYTSVRPVLHWFWIRGYTIITPGQLGRKVFIKVLLQSYF